MINRHSDSGFTLLELMIVITIMMTLLSLVGSSALESIERAKAQTEIIELYSLVKKSSVHSFASGRSVALVFKGRQININIEGDVPSEKIFNHLSFDSQVVSFNRNGLPDKVSISLDNRGIRRRLIIASLVATKPYVRPEIE
ncbi:MAG: Uncharacterised protein [Porticoccaceae bacterium UBA1117]|nr:MAG: Uncharacterised protein [Porticoccaceae bacterium UBA1117]